MSALFQSAILAPVFFGTFTMTALFGVTTLKAHRYFVRHKSDSRTEKSLVIITLLLLAAHLGVSLFISYFLLVSAWDDISRLFDRNLLRAIGGQADLVVLVLTYVHSLYGLMTWKLSCHAHYSVTYIVLFVTLVGHGVGIFTIVETHKILAIPDPLSIIVDFTRKFGPSVIHPSYASAAIVDMVLAFFLCLILYKSRVEFPVSASKTSALAHYILASGLLVGILQLVAFIMAMVEPKSFVFYAISLNLPSAHAISYLSLLDARKNFRHGIRCATAPNMPFTVHIHTLTAVNTSRASSSQDDLKEKAANRSDQASFASSEGTVIEM
ncbi:hypothetical protein ONZ45_g13137 [Pleurotus djamor]|nr:hypothetical protein ONZ45_g13137 [Pleurotus djamor]